MSKFLLDNFVVVDLETTGFSAAAHQIIEVGAIKVDYRTGASETFEHFAACSEPLSPVIIRLTGITDDMLIGAQTPQTVVRQLADFIGGLPIVAYNASFDMGFLRAVAPRSAFATNDVICALKAARAHFDLPNHKLATVAKHLGIEQSSAHRALHDCLTTLKVIHEIRARSRRAYRAA